MAEERAGRVAETVQELVELSPVHVPGVVVGLALVAVAVTVGAWEALAAVLDLRWVVAAVLLASGAAVVLGVAVAAVRRALRDVGPGPGYAPAHPVDRQQGIR
ncbi:hypothetical protein CLV92_11166 [Kineococcus xinjiangensis]|uniref:Uncharacterized protein n=1 Tax=Kineococcus xinjiangensis TaxID=512762 RepID=A0A2S6IG10_9ACTN|nr:hypothetical protein [Kineococcus xinjiangensis]PPK93149.1 hypothetical protein CLV92_11166 [Kineococcus xinjiangensis]